MWKTKIACVLVFAVSAALFGYCVVVRDKVSDTNGPEITMDQQEIQVGIHASEEELLQGVSAVDKKDGDVTSSLVVERISNFVEEGRRKITIAAFDSNNNVSKITRDIVYIDYTSPQFELEVPLRFTQDESNYAKGLTATDCIDGDISDKIRLSYNEEIDYMDIGCFSVNYSVANSAGDVVNLPVTLEIYDSAEERENPKIILSEYLINIPVGQEVDPLNYLSEVIVDNVLYRKQEDGYFHGESNSEMVIGTDQFEIENPTDVNKRGVYEIVYSITDSEGDTGTVRLIVVVNR